MIFLNCPQKTVLPFFLLNQTGSVLPKCVPFEENDAEKSNGEKQDTRTLHTGHRIVDIWMSNRVVDVRGVSVLKWVTQSS